MNHPDDDRLREYVEDWLLTDRHQHDYRKSDNHFRALCRAVEQQAEFRGVSTVELRSLYDALN